MDETSEINSYGEPNALKRQLDLCRQQILNLFDVPEEIQEFVLEMLSVNDLISCCLVCKRWREGINQSGVWKKWCLREGYDFELMERSFALMSEGFREECGVIEAEGVYGHWRKIYEWHERLRLHWKNQKVMSRRFLSSGYEKVVGLQTDGERVAVIRNDSSLTIWSIKSAAPIMVAQLMAVLQGHPILSIRINKDSVIVVQRKLLQVFHFQKPKYVLTGLKCFELGKNNEDLLDAFEKQGSKFSHWYFECFRAKVATSANWNPTGPVLYDVLENMVYATVSNSSEVRSWSLPDCEPSTRYEGLPPVAQILSDKTDLYLIAYCDEATHFLKYVSKTQSFEELLSVPGLKSFLIGYGLVVAYPSPGDVKLKRIRAFWNDRDMGLLRIRDVSEQVGISLYSPHYIAYIEKRLIHLWDPIADNVLARFLVDGHPYHCQLTFSTYALVLTDTSLQLWDWQKGTRLYRVQTMLNVKARPAGNLVWADSTRILNCMSHELEMLSFI